MIAARRHNLDSLARDLAAQAYTVGTREHEALQTAIRRTLGDVHTAGYVAGQAEASKPGVVGQVLQNLDRRMPRPGPAHRGRP